MKTEREIILGKTGGVCFWCEVPLTLKTITIDHIIPLKMKPNLGLKNKLPACLPCNNDKGGTHPLAYLNLVEAHGPRPNAKIRGDARYAEQCLIRQSIAERMRRIHKRHG